MKNTPSLSEARQQSKGSHWRKEVLAAINKAMEPLPQEPPPPPLVFKNRKGVGK